MSSVPDLQRARDAAVLADPPEVNRQEDDKHEREHQDVEGVPAEQGVGADLDAAELHEPDLVTKHGREADHVRSHRHRPEGQLVPWE